MKSDLSSSNYNVSAVAIANLTLTASPDLARDLADEVQRLLESGSPYLRKKAAFCAGKLIRKVPEIAELFEPAIPALLSDKNHSVVLGAICLVESMLAVDPHYVSSNRERLIPILVRHLQTVASSSNYSAEYDISGVFDPFLQVRILRLMRELSAGDLTCSLSIADILTQVATCTDSSRNSGHSVLYETAVTIMGIEGDAALEAMAVGILAKLIASPSSDPNLRYVSNFYTNIDCSNTAR
jgi:AP-1 complex subunit gamma-1